MPSMNAKKSFPGETAGYGDNLPAKVDAPDQRQFRTIAASITKRIAAAGLVAVAAALGAAPKAEADTVTDYYYIGTGLTGFVAWDSTLNQPAVINGVPQVALYGGGHAFNADGSGSLDINGAGQVIGWDLQAYLLIQGGLYGDAATVGGDQRAGGGAGEQYASLVSSNSPYYFQPYQNSNASGSWTNLSIAKNLGSPSLLRTPTSQSSSPFNPSVPLTIAAGGCANPTPDCSVADPINTATGNLFETETDFTGAAVTGLGLTRYYNSQDTTSSAFGAGWHSTWHRALNPISPSLA